jgi:hypothetical protein
MYNEMQFEDLNPKPKIFQAELTKAQYKFLAKMMPSEYLLEVISKPKKELPPQPKRNPMMNKTATAKPLRSKTDDSADIPTNPLDFSLSMESTTTFPTSRQTNQSAQPSQVGSMPDMFGSHPMMYQFHNMGTQQPNNFQLQEAQSPKKDKSKIDKNQLKAKKKTGEEKQRQTSTAPNAKPFKAPTEIMAKCAAILQSLKRNSLAEPFLYPVDPKSMGVPSFYTLVKEPMDLSTVEKKLKNNDYLNSSQFVSDVRKIWKNALTSNVQGSDIFRRAQEMNRLFEEAVKELDSIAQKPTQEPSSTKVEKKPPGKPQQQPQTLQMPPAQGQIPRQSNGPSSTLGNITIVDTEPSNFRQTSEQPPLSQTEKQTLHQKILTKIPAQSLKGVWDIVSESYNAQTNKEMLEFDLDTLPVEITRKLERYVDHVLKLKSIQNKPKEMSQPQIQGNRPQPQPQNFQFSPYNSMMMPPQKAVKLDQAEKKMVAFPSDPTAMFPFFPEPDLKTQTTGYGGGFSGFNGFWNMTE